MGRITSKYSQFRPWFLIPFSFLQHLFIGSQVEVTNALNLSVGAFILFYFILFYFMGQTCGIWTFPGEGSNQSCSCRPTPQPQQCQTGATSVTYAAAFSNTGSLTHWVRPESKPASSQTCRVLNLLSHNGNSEFGAFKFYLSHYSEQKKKKKKKKKTLLPWVHQCFKGGVFFRRHAVISVVSSGMVDPENLVSLLGTRRHIWDLLR